MRKIRVFVGSPGDVPQERNIVSTVVDELSRSVATFIPAQLEAVRWETHAWPDVGDDAQDVINREIGDYDVFVGLMWKRFGTPTKRAKSGTGEEFERAYEYFKEYQRPKIMFYFCKAPFYSTDKRELQQFMKVVEFRKRLEKYGTLFWEYDEPIDFERRFREHLTRQILQLRKPTPGELTGGPKIFLSYKRQDIERVEPIYEALRLAGFVPWMDVRDILPGGRWVEEIEKAIKSADFFLSFVSVNTVALGVPSQTGFSVNSERKLFNENVSGSADALKPTLRSHFIPVRLDPVQPPPEIAAFQWIDVFSQRSSQTLINTIRKVWEVDRNRVQ